MPAAPQPSKLERMLRISPTDVLGARALLTWVLRLVAAFLVIYGAFLVLARVTYASLISVSNPGFLDRIRVWEGVGQDHGWVRGWPMLIVGLALAFTAVPLARWIIRVPDSGCPGCQYAGTRGKAGRCPECGLDGIDSAED